MRDLCPLKWAFGLLEGLEVALMTVDAEDQHLRGSRQRRPWSAIRPVWSSRLFSLLTVRPLVKRQRGCLAFSPTLR